MDAKQITNKSSIYNHWKETVDQKEEKADKNGGKRTCGHLSKLQDFFVREPCNLVNGSVRSQHVFHRDAEELVWLIRIDKDAVHVRD